MYLRSVVGKNVKDIRFHNFISQIARKGLIWVDRDGTIRPTERGCAEIYKEECLENIKQQVRSMFLKQLEVKPLCEIFSDVLFNITVVNKHFVDLWTHDPIGVRIVLDKFPEHDGHLIELWIPVVDTVVYTCFNSKLIQKRCEELDFDAILVINTPITLDEVTR